MEEIQKLTKIVENWEKLFYVSPCSQARRNLIKSYGAKKLPEYLRKHPDLYEVYDSNSKGKLRIIEYKIKENAF